MHKHFQLLKNSTFFVSFPHSFVFITCSPFLWTLISILLPCCSFLLSLCYDDEDDDDDDDDDISCNPCRILGHGFPKGKNVRRCRSIRRRGDPRARGRKQKRKQTVSPSGLVWRPQWVQIPSDCSRALHLSPGVVLRKTEKLNHNYTRKALWNIANTFWTVNLEQTFHSVPRGSNIISNTVVYFASMMSCMKLACKVKTKMYVNLSRAFWLAHYHTLSSQLMR